MNKSMKKKALVSSILTIALCFSVITGATLALFTSESEVNIAITSGKVDVKASIVEETLKLSSLGVEQTTGKFATGGTATFDAETNLDLAKVVPGDKATFDIKVVNNSNVDIQYKVKWTVNGELADVLVATADGEKLEDVDWAPWDATTNEKTIKVSVELPMNVDNKYQEKDAKITFTVEAIQANAVAKEAATLEQLEAALNAGVSELKLVGDIALTDTLEITNDVAIDLAGNELAGNLVVSEDAELKLTNGDLTNTNANVSAIQLNGGEVTLDNVQISSARHGVRVEGGKLVINDGYYTVNPNSSKTQHAINIGGAAEESTVIINGGTFVGPKGTMADSGSAVNVQSNATLVINGGNFSGGKTKTISGAVDAITINGGTFDQDPSAYAKGCKVTTNTDGTYTVEIYKATDSAALDETIKNGGGKIQLGSGTYIIPDSAQGKTLTIVGNGETVIATQDDGSYEGCDYSLDGATVTFEGINITTDSTTYTGYARLNATYNKCTINGTYTLYGNSVFNDCTFNVSGDVYNIWTWGAPNAEFNNCTFNSDGKAVLLYGTVNTNLTVNNCTFNDKGGLTDLKAAIEIGNDYGKSYTLTVNNTVVNGYEIRVLIPILLCGLTRILWVRITLTL